MVKTAILRLWQSRRFFYWPLAFAFLLISYLVFSQPTYAQPVPHTDKIGHWGSFMVLAFLTYKALGLPRWLDFLLLCSYGALIEVVQSFIPYRSGALDDLVADIAGILTFYLAHYLYVKFTRGRD